MIRPTQADHPRPASPAAGVGRPLRAGCLLAGLALAAAPAPAAAQDTDIIRQMLDALTFDSVMKDWDITLGAGASVVPEYEGSDEFTVRPLPQVDIVWRDRVFLNMQRGLGVYALNGPSWRLGGSIGFDPGRDEDDSDHLTGLGDVDAAAQAQLFGAYRLGAFSLSLDLAQDLGGAEGLVIEPGVTFLHPLTETLTLAAGVSATWASDDHMAAYFGVTGPQARRSGYARYQAEAGFKRVDATLALNWRFTESWSARAFVGVGQLMGDAADSPITKDEVQPSAGLFLAYTF